MQTVTGFMTTDRPARYAKQLTSHWAKQGPVSEEDGAIVQRWDSGQVITMTPQDTGLVVEVGVPDEDPTRFADVVKRHLERFGQRDELELVWNDAAAG